RCRRRAGRVGSRAAVVTAVSGRQLPLRGRRRGRTRPLGDRSEGAPPEDGRGGARGTDGGEGERVGGQPMAAIGWARGRPEPSRRSSTSGRSTGCPPAP